MAVNIHRKKPVVYENQISHAMVCSAKEKRCGIVVANWMRKGSHDFFSRQTVVCLSATTTS
jgi:hypothetical protein